MVNRSTVMLAIFAVALLLWLAGMLVKYQIVNYNYYQTKAISQQTMDTTLNAQRGTIYSRNYTALAKSAPVETVYLAPNSIDKEDTAKCRLIASGLAEILGVDEETVYQKTQKNNYYEMVKRRIESETADKVRAFVDEHDLKGIHLVEDTKRYYPYNSLACHILGFTGTDNVGLDGIESIYNEYLQGTSGKLITAKNAVGTELPIEYETYVEAENGKNVVLTMRNDLRVRHRSSRQFCDRGIWLYPRNQDCRFGNGVGGGHHACIPRAKKSSSHHHLRCRRAYFACRKGKRMSPICRRNRR